MLTRELGIADYDRGQLIPDRLIRGKHAAYLSLADRMLKVYRDGVGCTRSELHAEVQRLFDDQVDCPARRIAAFCKLLDEVAEYERDRRGRARELRRTVFRRAAEFHPLVRHSDRMFEHEERQVKQMIATELNQPWAEIEQQLFSDVIPFQRLKSFEGYPSPEALLSRYNVAQVQVALYDAVSMTVWARADLKRILRFAKLARLMHEITRQPHGTYVIEFSGPSSLLRRTRRYGVAMARFVPSLITCRDWKMRAVLQRRRGFNCYLQLTSGDGLGSQLPAAPEFDSGLEAQFAESWGDEPRDGWRLEHESEVLHSGQTTFVPDFVLRHDDGRQVLLEIVGFWTPEYLAKKRETLTLFADRPILLAVAKSLALELDSAQVSPRHDVIWFQKNLRAELVLDALANGP